MRRLWIRRHKGGGNAKMTVYIEDRESGDVAINGLPCRKLGELGNDQQRHFSIGQEEAKVFVAAGKIKGDVGFLQIPEGREDVFLSGQKQGSMFRFDDAEEEELPSDKKKRGGLGKVILVVAIVLGIAAGIFAGRMITDAVLSGREEPATEKTFTVQNLTITLTDRFTETEVDGYAACYAAEDAAVFVLREAFDIREGFGDLSLTEYGVRVLENNGLTKTAELGEYGGLTAFHHVSHANEKRFYNYVVLLKGEDAFWMVQITAPAEDAEKNMVRYQQWAQSIVLS